MASLRPRKDFYRATLCRGPPTPSALRTISQTNHLITFQRHRGKRVLRDLWSLELDSCWFSAPLRGETLLHTAPPNISLWPQSISNWSFDFPFLLRRLCVFKFLSSQTLHLSCGSHKHAKESSHHLHQQIKATNSHYFPLPASVINMVHFCLPAATFTVYASLCFSVYICGRITYQRAFVHVSICSCAHAQLPSVVGLRGQSELGWMPDES